ncbi:hypothetical protein ACPYO6_10260 [Georgenia sp. Z1344]|uniref:hypothetical protein n=1 Tax=Georgenia sp. Z1344 TaxID=3416706 RepID=UPI003CEE0E10
MARTIRSAIVPALALGALLAGCSANPGTAAVIDGEEMSEREAQSVAGELVGVFGQELTTVDAVMNYAYSDAITRVAGENGLTVSDQAVRDQLATMTEQSGYTPDGDYLPQTLEIVESLMLAGQLQSDQALSTQVTEAMSEVDIELNPRYGTVEGGQYAQPAHPWLQAAPAGEGMPVVP